MNNSPQQAPRFACDAMLGGLARWLRAAGYDASWHPDIADWDLIRLARHEQRILLSSDTGIFRIGLVRDGDLPGIWIPHGLSRLEQLGFVLEKLSLPMREPRCMACSGELVEAAKDQVRDQVPPRSFAWQEQFWRCRNCGRIFWQGTHWDRISRQIQALREKPRSAKCNDE